MPHTHGVNSGQTKLFLDIDGVLLGKINGRIALAKGAEEFIRFATAHFDCYWLTTHCQGDAEIALTWMKPYVHKGLLGMIKPTSFNVLKTDALPKEGGFFWVDDQPMASELKLLEDNGLLSCLLRVDTYRNREDLVECLGFLQNQIKQDNIS